MAHNVTIDSTVKGLNDFVKKFGPQIHQKMKQGLELETEVPWVDCAHTYTGQDIEVGSVLQAYQPQFTPNNVESFDGIDNTLRPIKVDLLYTAEQLEKFFDKWRPNWFEPDPEKIRTGYAAYVMNNHLLPQIMEDLNLASWKGKFVAPVAGTPGAVLESVDGHQESIKNQINSGRLVPLAGAGALVSSTMVEQVREFCKEIPEPYRYKKAKILMSKTRVQEYADNYQELYPHRDIVTKTPDRLYVNVDHYNKTLVGITAMEGSDRMICVFDNMSSMINGTRSGRARYFNWRFEKRDRTIKVFAEIYRFYGFETCLHTYVNDQE